MVDRKRKLTVERVDWSVDQVCEFISTLGAFQNVIDAFQREKIDGATLLNLSDLNLKALGVPMRIRNQILSATKTTASNSPTNPHSSPLIETQSIMKVSDI